MELGEALSHTYRTTRDKPTLQALARAMTRDAQAAYIRSGGPGFGYENIEEANGFFALSAIVATLRECAGLPEWSYEDNAEATEDEGQIDD